MLCKGVMQHVRGMSHQINDVIYKGQLGTYQLSFSSHKNTLFEDFFVWQKLKTNIIWNFSWSELSDLQHGFKMKLNLSEFEMGAF